MQSKHGNDSECFLMIMRSRGVEVRGGWKSCEATTDMLTSKLFLIFQESKLTKIIAKEFKAYDNDALRFWLSNQMC